jgi:EmrB/QacA subfamily drug resistance transporter
LRQAGGHKWWVLSVAAVGVLLATIDASIVNIALPTIKDYFHTSVQTIAWVTMSYLLVVTVFLLIFGRLSDAYGQKLVFVSGMAFFTAGSGLCALSGSAGQLIAFRAFQGLGAAMIMSNTSAIVTNAFPPEQRGTGLGVIGGVVSVGLMLGPALGGIIIHYFGWQYIFLVNLPVGLGGVVLSLRILGEHRADTETKLFHPLDSLLWIAGVSSFVLVFGVSSKGGFSFVEAGLYTCLSLVLIGFFFARQFRSERPLFYPYLLRNDIFMLSSAAGFFTYMGMMGVSFMMPFFLEKSIGLPPLQTGKILMTVPATTVFASPLAGFLSDKFGQRRIATTGLGIWLLSVTGLFMFNTETSTVTIVLNLVGLGLGLGLFGSPNNSALMGSVDLKSRGSAAGLLATVRNLGMVSGIGIVSLMFNYALRLHQTSVQASYSNAFRQALPAVLAFSVVAMVFSALRRSV